MCERADEIQVTTTEQFVLDQLIEKGASISSMLRGSIKSGRKLAVSIELPDEGSLAEELADCVSHVGAKRLGFLVAGEYHGVTVTWTLPRSAYPGLVPCPSMGVIDKSSCQDYQQLYIQCAGTRITGCGGCTFKNTGDQNHD